jgi:hypothetical protein
VRADSVNRFSIAAKQDESPEGRLAAAWFL